MANASETIASGFSAHRKAIGDQLEELTGELVNIAGGHLSITIYRPHSEAKTRPEIRLVDREHIIKRHRLIGHLSRRIVYKTLEEKPELSTFDEITTAAPLPLRRGQVSAHYLGFTFDQESAAAMQDQHTLIGEGVAELAGLTGGRFRALKWPVLEPEVILAIATPDTPDLIIEKMHQTLESHAGLTFMAGHVRILPRLERPAAQ